MGADQRALLLVGVGVAALAVFGAAAGGAAVMATEKRAGILAGLTAPTRAAAERLALAADAEGIPVTWTSGRRSTLEQAGAMLAKVARGEDLFDLYRSAHDTLRKLYAAPRTAQAWAAILDASPPLSRHLAGEALDVRRWGLTSAQLYRLGELAIAAGFGRALLESDHLHLQMP